MSRQIRFRAWGKNSKEYLGYGTKDGISLTLKNIQNIEDLDSWIFEQDTGLKDKNGESIWEGDIVAEHNGGIIGKISQHKSGEWQIEWIGVYGGVSRLYDHRDLCEVIGSIRENPELLEEK